MLLPACYDLCGTALAYAATRCAVLSDRMLLRICYAMRGTELAYAARRLQRHLSPMDSALISQIFRGATEHLSLIHI
eukprot:2124418-Rhodomonas_salina.2